MLLGVTGLSLETPEMNTEDTPLCGSWPRLGTAKGQYHTIKEPAPARGSTSRPFPRTSESASEPCKKRNFAAVLSRATCSSDDDYEDPELQLAEARTAMRILPARPLKESEYADTRHLKAVMDAPLPLSPDKQRQSLQRTREERKPSSQDIRSPHLTGDRPTKGNKIPFPPPRPPLTLPKQYQPLPPEPPEIPFSPLDCYTPCHILPEAPRGPRQISLKDLSKVLGVDKVSHHPTRLEASYPSQSNLRTEAAVASSSFMPKSRNMQDRGSMHSCSQQRCPSPASFGPRENVPLHKNTNQSKPVPALLREKELLHKEWYIGECSRQAVEEALMKESKDGTFLVRDCSTKSKAEPYVLVIFHGNKVYNVKIRFLEKGQQFALGTGLRGDEKFDSVEDIIEHYKYSPIMLIDGKDKTGVHREECYLTQPLRLTRHLSPW